MSYAWRQVASVATEDEVIRWAESRADQVREPADRYRFVALFHTVRHMAPSLRPNGLRELRLLTDVDPVAEAAHIEALASLRAQGVAV